MAKKNRIFLPPIEMPVETMSAEEQEMAEEAEGISRPDITENTDAMVADSGIVAGGIVTPPPKKKSGRDDMRDLFEVPSRSDADMDTEDLTSVSEEDVFGEGGEDMSDLLNVSNEDVMGEDPKPKTRLVKKYRRGLRDYNPSPPGLGGIRL
jgi:hypothetical protein